MFLFPADAFSDFIRIVDAIRSNVLTIKTNRFDPAWKMHTNADVIKSNVYEQTCIIHFC